MNKRIIDLGVFEVDPTDRSLRAKLEKMFSELSQKNEFYKIPFKKQKGGIVK